MSSPSGKRVVGAQRADRSALFSAGKFLPPRLPSGYVARARLDAALDRADPAGTTVVCGPAGAGKSTLVSAFVGRRDEPSSWITLDERDNDPAVFWTSASYAFDRLFGGTPATEEPDRDDPARQFARRARELHAEATRDSYLVIDAAQVLAPETEQYLLLQLADALPQSVRLVVVSRRQPALPLHRLRAHSELVEISERDLRFSQAEALALFGAAANRADVSARVDATQGWAAGLVLALDPAASPNEVERAVRAYLYEEVVKPQPADVQRFLAAIACLQHFNAAVCERVTGRTDAAEMLRQLESEHAFVTGDRVEWGRYDMQPQLRAMLRDDLRASDPDRAAAIFADGARWYEEHDDPAAAIEQWLDAGRDHDALRCLRRAINAFGDTQPARLREWTTRIDPVAAAGQPALLLDLAVACALAGDDTGALDATERADNLLRAAPDPTSEFRSTLVHARLALGAGDIESAVVALQAGRDLIRAEPTLVQAALSELPFARWLHAWLALGQYWLGYPSEGRATLLARPTRSGERAADCALAWGVEAAIAFSEGYLDEAFAYATRARDAATAAHVIGWCTFPADHVLAALTRERASAESARRAFESLVRATKDPPGNVFSVAAHVGLAHALRTRGDATGALDRLSSIGPSRSSPARAVTQSWIDHNIAMTYVRMGQVRAARDVLGPPPYRPAEALIAALAALADGHADEAVRLVAAMPRDAPRPRLLATLIEARAAVLQDDVDRAIDGARLAMRIAQEHGFLRSVLEYGTALLPEFESAAVTAADAEFVSRLRDELALSSLRADRRPDDGSSGLSGRELDVLRYLATHLSTREIAEALHVSRNTVKSHMQHLYRKLGVGTREAAVERARTLQLLR